MIAKPIHVNPPSRGLEPQVTCVEMEFSCLHGVILWCYIKLIQKRQGVSFKKRRKDRLLADMKKSSL